LAHLGHYWSAKIDDVSLLPPEFICLKNSTNEVFRFAKLVQLKLR
jgi:hypothetical protein